MPANAVDGISSSRAVSDSADSRAQPWKAFFNQTLETDQAEDVVTVGEGEGEGEGGGGSGSSDKIPHVAA
ncbi:hypothetical protein ACJZ2D_009386 [Fusarium nematophilum]